MKVNKSSVECAAYNARNKESIELGLEEAQEPNDQIVAAEKAQAAREAAGFKEAADKLTMLKQLDPNTDGKTCLGVPVVIEDVRSVGYSYSHRAHKGYRMYFGYRYGGRNETKWMVVGDKNTLGFNLKQLEKAKEILAQLVVHYQAKAVAKSAAEQATERYKAFYAVPGNKDFLLQLTGRGWVSEHGTDGFRVNEDGTLTFNDNRFTQAQWEQILALRAKHKQEMEALKATFTPANA